MVLTKYLEKCSEKPFIQDSDDFLYFELFLAKMRKKIDYKALCLKAIEVLEYVHVLSDEFSKFELSKPVRTEIEEVIQLSGKDRELKEPYKELFSELIEDICKIKDNLHEIEMVTSNLIRKANELSEEARKEWFERAGIENIPKEFEGLGEGLQDKIYEMLEMVEEVLEESDKYFLLEKEDYINYEDEIEE